MGHNTVKAIRVHRSASEIRALLKEQEQSNVTVNEFCEMYDIRRATFYNWRNRYNTEMKKPEGFITLQISGTGTGTSVFGEIELPGKGMIRLYQPVDPSYFKALL